MLPLPNKQTMTVREVAEVFSVHPDTVYRWIRAGKLPMAYRPSPRTTRISTESVRKLLEKVEVRIIDLANGQRAWDFENASNSLEEGEQAE